MLHDMLAELPPDQAGDETEFLTRLGQFAEINSNERMGVLSSRTQAVQAQLAHYRAMHELSAGHRHPWGALVTAELIRRHEQELTWLAGLAELAQEDHDRPAHLTFSPA